MCLILAYKKNFVVLDSLLADLTGYIDRSLDKSGCFSDGSNHYQILISTWCLSLFNYLSQLGYNSSTLRSMHKFRLLCNFIKEVSDDLYIKNFRFSSPFLQGDISPDLNPIETSYLYAKESKSLGIIRKLGNVNYLKWGCLCEGISRVYFKNVNAVEKSCKLQAHSHNDYLSFGWRHGNDLILGDLGKARYTNEPASFEQKNHRGHSGILINNKPIISDYTSRRGYISFDREIKRYAFNTQLLSSNKFRFIASREESFLLMMSR